MVSNETLEIILRAVDNATETTQKVEDKLGKVGDAAEKANQKAMSAEQRYQQKVQQTITKLDPVISKLDDIGETGSQSFTELSSSQQEAIAKFNMLDKETQDTLRAIRELGGEMDHLEGAERAVQSFISMDSHVKTLGGSIDLAKSKMQLMGTNTDSLKGKIQAVGTGIQTYIGNKWDTMKSKVSSFGSYIKTQLGNALQSVRSKLDSLGGAFSGLGGIISSAIGGLGMASITDMTVGLAMNRDRMTSLTSAVMGGQQAGEGFVNTMDKLTDNSLVSLDNLGQAMSTIKMSTGMSNAELEKFTTTVNDVGQRAILMGYDGDQAMSLMQAAGRGLNGEFDMLKSNFGITKEQLESLGWSGAADDVEGYQAALDKALEKGGSMEGMMNTTTGKLEILKKNFRVAGRHVGEMFTPYIEQAVDWLNSLKDSCPGLFENLVMVAGAISMFATVAPAITPVLTALDQIGSITKGALTFVGLLEAEEGALTASGLAASASQTMLAIAEAAGADAAVLETAANGGLTASFWAMASAILANPLTWVAVALIAVAVAVYEVGKSFGWWTDVQSMLAAVWSGIQRLWNAFTNHPDVQAAIQGIIWAWNQLTSAVSWAWQEITKFFNISNGGQFDIVRAIIDAIGLAWQGLTDRIRFAIDVIRIIAGAIGDFYNGTLVPFGSFLMELFMPVWQNLILLWNQVVTAITPLVTIFQQFQAGQVNLPTLLTAVWNTLVTLFSTVTNTIGMIVWNFINTLTGGALTAGANFVNGIINWIRQLPGRVYTWLVQTTTRIITQTTLWVNKAKAAARQLVTGVITFLLTLPGRAYSALHQVVSRIISAGQQWVSAAKQKAKAVVDGAYNTLSGLAGKVGSALNGVKDAIVKPFKDAYDQAKKIWDDITSLGGAAAGFDLGNGAAGYELESPNVPNVVSTGNTNEHVFSGEVTFVHDFTNLPNGVSADEVARIVETSTTSDQFMKMIAENMTFQNQDSKVKFKLNNKVNRARGV